MKHVPSEVLLLYPKVRKKANPLFPTPTLPEKKKHKDLIFFFLTSTPAKIMNTKDGLV
jgi:hypothetical protein